MTAFIGTGETGDEHPDLVALIRCELPNAEVFLAGEHLDACATCRSDLADLVVGSSVMGRAARTLASAPVATSYDGALPPLDLPGGHVTRHRGRWLLAVATVAAVGATGALALGLVRGSDSSPGQVAPAPSSSVSASPSVSVSPSPEPAGRSVGLAAVRGQTAGNAATGTVLMDEHEASTTLTVATDGLPDAATDQFYEAWLLDPATDKMLPLGVVSGADDATFEVANSLMDQYAALDLSLEADDGDPRHSAVSVLRGTY